MNSVGLFFALLWRTVVAYLVLGLTVLLVNALLSKAGIDLLPAEGSASVGFIKLKPTLMFASFALALLAAEIGLRLNLVRVIAGTKLNLSSGGWRQYVVGLSVLLFALAGLNMLVAATASVDTWITYKLYGASCLLLVGIFVLAYRVSRLPR